MGLAPTDCDEGWWAGVEAGDRIMGMGIICSVMGESVHKRRNPPRVSWTVLTNREIHKPIAFAYLGYTWRRWICFGVGSG